MAKLGWAILCSLSIFGCAPSISEPASQGGVSVSKPDVGNKLALPINEKQQSVLRGELTLPANIENNSALTVILTVSNPQYYGVPLLFSSGKSGDLFIFNDKGQKIWTWSEQMMFTQALREKVLGAGDNIKVKFAVPAKLIAELWGSDYTLQATFAGKAAESKSPVMNKVTQKMVLK